MPRSTSLALLFPVLAAPLAGPLLAVDTGDAPESYGLATHEIVVPVTLWFGKNKPDDNPPVAGERADGDDREGAVDDEDGTAYFFPELVQRAKRYAVDVHVTNESGVPATAIGWIDFDGNGRFDADESAAVSVPSGVRADRFELRWNDLSGISASYSGRTYVRFRITTDAIGPADAAGPASDGEVEDRTFDILPDVDGDQIADVRDTDNDNDGIPDEVEVIGLDSDGDGKPNYLDADSDGDGVPDFVEAGDVPATPIDSDGDGVPDYLDDDSDSDRSPDGEADGGDEDGDGLVAAVEGAGDSDGDGVPNVRDLDSDGDTIPDAIEAGGSPGAPVDTDRDGVPDFLDLDSDNDGVPDLYESNGGELDVAALDVDRDGRVDAGFASGENGLSDAVETEPDSGIPVFVIVDSDGDGVRDYRDLDSDGDDVGDVIEAGGTDDDANGLVDALRDVDGDGLPDAVDVDASGGVDADGDGIDDLFDTDIDGVSPPGLVDADGDGIADEADADVDGDGVVDGTSNALTAGGALSDVDGDGVPDLRDPDAIGGSAADDPNGDGVPGDDDGAADTPRDDGARLPRVETGRDGFGGCSVAAVSARDPLLPALALLATVLLALRGRRGARRDG